MTWDDVSKNAHKSSIHNSEYFRSRIHILLPSYENKENFKDFNYEMAFSPYQRSMEMRKTRLQVQEQVTQ